jgi:hypothetical protein
MVKGLTVKVVKERSLVARLLMLLAVAALVALVPALTIPLAAYILFKLAQLVRRRRLNARVGGVRLRGPWPLPSGRVRAAGLKKVGSLGACQLFILSEDPTCLLTLRGFTLMGSGYLYLKPLEPCSIDVKPLVNAALKMRRQLLLAFIVDPSRRGGLKVNAAALVSVRSSRRCLTVDEERVKELVEEVERCLDGVRAVMMSQPQRLELDVLKGEDLVAASELLMGGMG